MNKRGMELSINFIVILILSLSIFAFGIYMVRSLYGFASDIQEGVDLQTQKQVEQRLFEGGEKVAVPLNKRRIGIRDSYSFGLGILNTLGEAKSFPVQVNYKQMLTPQQKSFDADPSTPDYINNNWVRSRPFMVELDANEHKVIPLTVIVENQMGNGLSTLKDHIYIFNVCVFHPNSVKNTPELIGPNDCANMRLGELQNLYDGQVHKLYVTAD